MQSVHSPAPIIMIIIAAVVTSILLGLLLRRLGTYSEISKPGKLGILILLAIGVGFTIFTLILFSKWLPYFIITGIISLCFGLFTLYCRIKK